MVFQLLVFIKWPGATHPRCRRLIFWLERMGKPCFSGTSPPFPASKTPKKEGKTASWEVFPSFVFLGGMWKHENMTVSHPSLSAEGWEMQKNNDFPSFVSGEGWEKRKTGQVHILCLVHTSLNPDASFRLVQVRWVTFRNEWVNEWVNEYAALPCELCNNLL